MVRYKEPSVPRDRSLSVERGLPPLMERAGVAAVGVELIVHGTTLALNTIIQRRGASLGLVVSRAIAACLEIGRAQLANAFSFLLQKEEPLVPRQLVLDVSARLIVTAPLWPTRRMPNWTAIAGTFATAKVEQSQ